MFPLEHSNACRRAPPPARRNAGIGGVIARRGDRPGRRWFATLRVDLRLETVDVFVEPERPWPATSNWPAGQ